MVKPDGKLTITVGVDVFCVAAFQHLAAGFLPAVACQRDAERAGVSVRHPGPLCPVPDGVFQGGVGSGALDQAADAVGQVGRVLVLGGVHHAGHLAVICRFGRLRCGHPGVGRFGQGVIHLAGQLRAALAVFCHQRGGVSNQRIGIPGAVGVYVLPHQLPGFLVQAGQSGDVFIPRFRRYLHCLPQQAAAARAPCVPAPAASG